MLQICPPLTAATVDLSGDCHEPPVQLPRLEERFELQQILGEGGQGAVYQAVQRSTGRAVAIKVVEGDDRQAHERLLREAHQLARVRHPGVVSVLDAGMGLLDDERVTFLALELLPGVALKEVLAEERLAPKRALRLIRDALEAVDAIHRAGIVHRDLKPANLMLVHPGTSDERLVIVDFGLAWSTEYARLTRTGRIVGTPQYLAPEMLGRHEPTAALDVYQMALILVEMLTGAPVVRPTTPKDCMRQHWQGVTLPDGLPRYVRQAMERALRKRPADRFATADQLRRALREPTNPAWYVALFGTLSAAASAALVVVTLGLALAITPALATVQTTPAPAVRPALRSIPSDDAIVSPVRTERASVRSGTRIVPEAAVAPPPPVEYAAVAEVTPMPATPPAALLPLPIFR